VEQSEWLRLALRYGNTRCVMRRIRQIGSTEIDSYSRTVSKAINLRSSVNRLQAMHVFFNTSTYTCLDTKL
jgi:hypothetical protein